MPERPLFAPLEELVGPHSAGSWRRMFAAVADFIIVMLPAGILGMLVSLVPEGTLRDVLEVLGIAAIGCLAVVYGAVMEGSRYQATIGKILSRAMVTDAAGNRVSFRAALLRNIFKLVLVPIWPVSMGMINFSTTGQAPHDRIAKSLVMIGRPRRITRG
jgi:uncharacterized RDD family membrane protein YckC